MNKLNELLPEIKFHFHLQYPDLEECYLSGYEAALTGLNEMANPFSQGTKSFDFWLDGWWSGFYGEEPWFEPPAYLRVILKQHALRKQ